MLWVKINVRGEQAGAGEGCAFIVCAESHLDISSKCAAALREATMGLLSVHVVKVGRLEESSQDVADLLPFSPAMLLTIGGTTEQAEVTKGVEGISAVNEEYKFSNCVVDEAESGVSEGVVLSSSALLDTMREHAAEWMKQLKLASSKVAGQRLPFYPFSLTPKVEGLGSTSWEGALEASTIGKKVMQALLPAIKHDLAGTPSRRSALFITDEDVPLFAATVHVYVRKHAKSPVILSSSTSSIASIGLDGPSRLLLELNAKRVGVGKEELSDGDRLTEAVLSNGDIEKELAREIERSSFDAVVIDVDKEVPESLLKLMAACEEVAKSKTIYFVAGVQHASMAEKVGDAFGVYSMSFTPEQRKALIHFNCASCVLPIHLALTVLQLGEGQYGDLLASANSNILSHTEIAMEVIKKLSENGRKLLSAIAAVKSGVYYTELIHMFDSMTLKDIAKVVKKELDGLVQVSKDDVQGGRVAVVLECVRQACGVADSSTPSPPPIHAMTARREIEWASRSPTSTSIMSSVFSLPSIFALKNSDPFGGFSLHRRWWKEAAPSPDNSSSLASHLRTYAEEEVKRGEAAKDEAPADHFFSSLSNLLSSLNARKEAEDVMSMAENGGKSGQKGTRKDGDRSITAGESQVEKAEGKEKEDKKKGEGGEAETDDQAVTIDDLDNSIEDMRPSTTPGRVQSRKSPALNRGGEEERNRSGSSTFGRRHSREGSPAIFQQRSSRESLFPPGPGTYEVSSTWGGGRATALGYGRRGQFLHEALKSANSPGPIYDTGSPLVAPKVSTMRRTETWRFGKEKKSAIDFELKDKADMPGPGQYPSMSSLSNQAVSSRRTLPKFSMGVRLHNATSNTVVPGPGAHHDGLAGSPTRQGRKFGEGPRFTFQQGQERFKDWDEIQRRVEGKRGVARPGPGQYSSAPSVNKQVLSQRRTMPSHSFGLRFESKVEKVDNRSAGLSHDVTITNRGKGFNNGPKYGFGRGPPRFGSFM
eukprot:CAMPEP_0113896008 /NCGR_PEP_ID=MMETSP0780_2-20120614/17723_1 /TAXON_ID=652834 /ORGANISM="Palpitomonas bilix" /LENGTH=988 /DNA_ID=CAMNT_0000886989 /DNA_START=362 /DNA_END=3331 /DNA_ORIENTATION=+ /assembly_acc=CAM_ASM_000599